MENTRSKNRTRTKIKERLDGKDAAILISEDDANNSFLQKSEGQYKRTENSRRIPETSHKYEDNRRQHRYVFTQKVLTNSTKIKDVLNTNQGAIKQQK